MSAGSRAFVESLGQFGQSIQNLGETIYKVDADNIVKNKSLEYMQQVKEFNDSLLQDPDHGLPGQMSGYMLKWNDFKNKLMEDAQKVQNPLARKNLLQYVEQVSTDQYEKVSAYQFQNWSKSMVAAAQQRIETMLNDSTLTTKDKMDYMARELTDLRNFNIISPVEEQNIVKQYGQQIMVDDAKSQVLDALKTKGYGAAAQTILGLVGQTYTALGQTFTLGTENINGLMSYANVWENSQDKANQAILDIELGNALEGKPNNFTIENINAHPTSKTAYYFEQFKELNPVGADEYAKFIKIKDAIRTGSLYEGKPIDFDLLSSLKFKNTNYSYTLYNDWAATQPNDNLNKLSKAADNLLSTLVFGKIIDPNVPTLTPQMIDEMKVDDAVKAKYKEMYWSAQKQIQDKSQTDDNAKLIAKILNGTAKPEEVLASDSKYLIQNYSLYLSTQDRNKANAQDQASMEIMGLIFGATKDYEDGKDISEKLTAIEAKLTEKKGVITNPSVFAALNNEYLKLYQASVSKGSAEYLTKTLIPEINKNPSKYTLETIFSDSKLTFEDKIKAASALDLSNRQGTERTGIWLAANLLNFANGQPLEIPNKNLPVNLGPEKYDGMIERGNLDLNHRRVVKMPDGSIATVRSITIEEDGQYILIPTISKDGRVLTNEQAIEEYHNTGEHLGIFKSEEAADKYANELHESQAKLYEGATNDNILTEDWLNENKGQLSDQTYSTLLNALKTVRANAYITATEDTINSTIRNYKNDAYAKGAGDATEKQEIINIIDNARVLTPEKRAALKDLLDTIDLNADKIAKQREDEAFQAESREHARGSWQLEDQQRKEQKTKNDNASAKFSAFMQNLPNADTKTAQSNYDQFVKDIWGIYNNDPNTANTWIHAADVQLAKRLNANYATIDKRLSDAFDEYIKAQTIPGYKPTGEIFTEQLVKDLFPNATDTDNKMRDYWLNKKLTFDNSKEVLDAKAAPGKKEFSDGMRNMWNGLLGLPGYDPNNIISDDWFQTENAKNLDPTTYHEYSKELIAFNAALDAKKTQDQKAKQPNSDGKQDAPTAAEVQTAESYLQVLEFIADVYPAWRKNAAVGAQAPTYTFTIDGKQQTIVANEDTFRAIMNNNVTLFIKTHSLSKIGALLAKMVPDTQNLKAYVNVDAAYEKIKKGNPGISSQQEWRDLTTYIDNFKQTHPILTSQEEKQLIDLINKRKLDIELPQKFRLEQGEYDISEKWVEGTQKGDFTMFMAGKNGLAFPIYKGFESKLKAWKAASLEYINKALSPMGVQLKEGQNGVAETFLNGEVHFVVKDKAVLNKLGIGNNITSVRFYMGLYGKDALPIMETHQYNEKTKTDTISVYAYVPWLDNRNYKTKWVKVQSKYDDDGIIRRYWPIDTSLLGISSQSTNESTIHAYGPILEARPGTQ